MNCNLLIFLFLVIDISQYHCFNCIFEQQKTALVSIRHFFKKLTNPKVLNAIVNAQSNNFLLEKKSTE